MRLTDTSTRNGKRRGAASAFVRATRFIWVRLPWHQVTISVPWSKDRTYQSVVMTLTRGTNQSVVIDLTSLTPAELLAFRESVLLATEVAAPTVEALYQRAQEQHDAGDDSDDRIYRGLPTVVVRKGTFGEYDPELLRRREDVFRGIEARVIAGKLPPLEGDGLAESDEDNE